MPLFDTTQLGLERAISGAAARQTALASNIANANTPGFKPKDVDFHSALQAAFASDDPSKGVANAGFAETTQNGLEYQALIQVARGRIDILQSAIGGR
jgi:flagellar basal-body rod protein FlgB